MPSSKSFTRRDKIAISAISAFIFAVTVLRFSGTPDQYAVLYAFFENPGNFPNDIYLNNTFFFESSYFFAVNAFLGLDKNEIVIFAWYLAATAVAVYFTYLIISRHFGLTKPLEVFFILLFLSIVDRNFPMSPWVGIIPTAPGIPAMFAWPLGLMAVYCMLENRIWLSAAIVTVTISLHIVADFMLFPILFFFIVFNKETANKNLAALFLPVAYLLYKWLTTSVKIPSGQEAEQFYEAVKSAAGRDADFLGHPTLILGLFVASFIVFVALLRRLRGSDISSPNLGALLNAVFVASMLVVFFFTLYTTVGYKLFYFPPLIILTPVRGMNYFALFFYLSFFVLILQTTKLTSIEKASALLALVLLHGKSLNGILYPAVVLMGGTAVSRFSGDMLSWLKGGKALIPLGLALVIALTGARVATGTVYYTSFDTLSWKYMKRGRTIKEADESVWEVYQKIRNMKSDFVMLPLYRALDGKLSSSTFLNIFAKKSSFINDPVHLNFKAKLKDEHKVRTKAYDDIVSSIENNRPLSERARAVLQSRNVTIVVPERDSANLVGWTEKTSVNGFHLLRYSN